MKKAIIFDFDGVIADTEKRRFSDLKTILHSEDRILDERFFKRSIGKKTGVFLEAVFPELTAEKIRCISQWRRGVQCERLEDYKLIKGLTELLVFLKSKRLSLAIATGSRQEFVEKILHHNSIRNYFDVLVTGEMFSSSKPDPECFKLALDILDMEPKDVLVIEDSIAGIKAAKSAGCDVFAIMTYFNREQLSLADRIFEDHRRILEHLLNMN